MEKAHKSLASIAASHSEKIKTKKKTKKKSKAVTFVGIHSRRTDHIEYEAKQGMVPIKTSYFLNAMDAFRCAIDQNIFDFLNSLTHFIGRDTRTSSSFTSATTSSGAGPIWP
jgi:hypothetical protein